MSSSANYQEGHTDSTSTTRETCTIISDCFNITFLNKVNIPHSQLAENVLSCLDATIYKVKLLKTGLLELRTLNKLLLSCYNRLHPYAHIEYFCLD